MPDYVARMKSQKQRGRGGEDMNILKGLFNQQPFDIIVKVKVDQFHNLE